MSVFAQTLGVAATQFKLMWRERRLLWLALAVLLLAGASVATSSARLAAQAQERRAVAEQEEQLWDSQGVTDPHDAAHVGRAVPAPVRPLGVAAAQMPNLVIHLSVLTLGEIQKGVPGCPPGRENSGCSPGWIGICGIDFLVGCYRSRMRLTEWGLLAGEAKQKGIAAPVIDTLLAATARQHNLVLVTRNIKDFEPFSVHLLNPWL